MVNKLVFIIFFDIYFKFDKRNGVIAVVGINNKDKELREYTCPYCGYFFTQYVGEYNNVVGRHNGTDHVKCKQCQNYVKS